MPHWTHRIAVEEDDRRRRTRKEEEDEEGGEGRGEETHIKSNNPHLTGGEIYGNTVPKLHSLDIISNSSEILTFCWEVIILWICSRDSRFQTHNSLADAFLSPKPSWESCQNQKHTSASRLWCCPSGMGKLWALVCLRDCEGLLPIGPSQSLISASMSSVGYLNDTISTRCFNPSEAFM